MGKIKIEVRNTTLADAASTAYGELQCLRDEAQEMYDNASEGLQQTQRIQTMQENADALGNNCDDEPEWPDAVGEHPMAMNEWHSARKGRGLSRADRCAWACSVLEQCCEKLDDVLTNGGFKGVSNDDVEALKEKMDELKNDAEGLEWPGMYG